MPHRGRIRFAIPFPFPLSALDIWIRTTGRWPPQMLSLFFGSTHASKAKAPRKKAVGFDAFLHSKCPMAVPMKFLMALYDTDSFHLVALSV